MVNVDTENVKFVFWRDGQFWLGYCQEYPDRWTQGESLEDLWDHLVDLYEMITSGVLPGTRQTVGSASA